MRKIFLATLFALGLFAGTSQASLITFDNLNAGPLGAYSESEFQVVDATGNWSQSGAGLPGPAIISNLGPTTSAFIVTGLSYPTFTFGGLDVAGVVRARNSQMTIAGYLDGVQVLLMRATIPGNLTFLHYPNPDALVEIDSLTISFLNIAGARVIVDNIEVNGIASTATPEPATLASAGLAIVAGLVARRRRGA